MWTDSSSVSTRLSQYSTSTHSPVIFGLSTAKVKLSFNSYRPCNRLVWILSHLHPFKWSSLVSIGVCGWLSSERPSSLLPCSHWLLCVRKSSTFKPEAPVNSWNYIISTSTWTYELCSAGVQLYANINAILVHIYIYIYCIYLCLCVCVRSCHTFFGEECVPSVVAWTGGFAERSRETRLFWGLNFFS